MTLSILGEKYSICSVLKNANCLRALARVERHASLRVSILSEHLEYAQNAHGVRKIDFLRDYQGYSNFKVIVNLERRGK